MFKHHPDGHIKIGNFEYPLSEFMLDEPAYTLPSGAIGRRYTPGSAHILFDSSNQWGGPLPWPEGDTYLAKEVAYKAAYAVRHPPPTLLTSQQIINAAADAAIAKISRDALPLILDMLTKLATGADKTALKVLDDAVKTEKAKKL